MARFSENEAWMNAYRTLQDSSSDLAQGFVQKFERAVQDLTNGDTAQVCLVRVGNSLDVQWQANNVNPPTAPTP